MKKKVFWLILTLFCSTWAQAEKTVLVIGSYHAEYPWEVSYNEGIAQGLAGKYRVERFQMDSKRRPPDTHQAKADEAMARYEVVQPDLVILGDDNALNFLIKPLSDKGVPTVFLGMNGNPRDLAIDKMPTVVGILERPLYKRSITDMDAIMKGKLQRVLVLFDNDRTSWTAKKEAFGDQSTLNIGQTQVDIKLIGTLMDWQAAVQQAKKEGYDAMIIGLYHTLVDASGSNVPSEDVLSWTSQNASIPPFAFWDFAVGADKAIGGLVLFGETQGLMAASIASEILSGKSPEEVKPQIRIGDRGRSYFSKAQLDKWHLTLPDQIAIRATLVD